ncbi:MAG TPA: FHA domain-containing protein [Candidatus Thermoplasmatota archaeon]|nr:FHA domain-containing protein [Candidatus Thermoplasmatota archaeon]
MPEDPMTTPPAESRATDPLESLAEDLDALSNIQRLRLLHLLTRPRYAEEIADALGMSRQSALKHIEKLQERGFVRPLHGRRSTGPVIEFLVVPQRLFATGVAIGDLGNLEPEGGPAVRMADRTVVLDKSGTPVEAPPASETRSAHILLINGPAAGSRYVLQGESNRWTLGRDEDRSLRLAHDPFISGRHAEIQQDSGGHVLVDVFSANGTFLNFSRIPRGGRVPLKIGDVIGLGHTFLVYQRE